MEQSNDLLLLKCATGFRWDVYGFSNTFGTVSGSKSSWGLSYVTNMFWEAINFIVLFFHTMISPNLTKKGSQYTSDYRAGGGPPPPPPRKRFGRIGGTSGGPGSPPPPPAGG